MVFSATILINRSETIEYFRKHAPKEASKSDLCLKRNRQETTNQQKSRIPRIFRNHQAHRIPSSPPKQRESPKSAQPACLGSFFNTSDLEPQSSIHECDLNEQSIIWKRILKISVPPYISVIQKIWTTRHSPKKHLLVLKVCRSHCKIPRS